MIILFINGSKSVSGESHRKYAFFMLMKRIKERQGDKLLLVSKSTKNDIVQK